MNILDKNINERLEKLEKELDASKDGINILSQRWFWSIIASFLIVFSFTSCGSETTKEPVLEVDEVTEMLKASTQASPTTIKEVIVPPTLSLIESPALNENNLVAFGFRSSKAG